MTRKRLCKVWRFGPSGWVVFGLALVAMIPACVSAPQSSSGSGRYQNPCLDIAHDCAVCKYVNNPDCNDYRRSAACKAGQPY